MESDEHQALASVIRGWHVNLRKQVRSGNKDDDELWEDCTSNAEELKRYSEAMHRLATTYWEKNNSQTRIDWCYSICKEYFFGGGLQKATEKVNRLHLRQGVELCNGCQLSLLPCEKLLLLDVGSCYNPFSKYEDMVTVAVDLCPATRDVLKCDFLKLAVNEERIPNMQHYLETLSVPSLHSLPREAFHVVVFSMLLEYMPTPRQRWTCCMKAADLLLPGGLLLVVTPDSKHQSHNVAMIKSWCRALSHLNLRRIKYSKEPHLHCLAFRKDACGCCARKDLGRGDRSVRCPDLCACNTESLSKMMYIPQDFHDYEKEASVRFIPRPDADDGIVREAFGELPFQYD